MSIWPLQGKASKQYQGNQDKAAIHVGDGDVTPKSTHEPEESYTHLVEENQVPQIDEKPTGHDVENNWLMVRKPCVQTDVCLSC